MVSFKGFHENSKKSPDRIVATLPNPLWSSRNDRSAFTTFWIDRILDDCGTWMMGGRHLQWELFLVNISWLPNFVDFHWFSLIFVDFHWFSLIELLTFIIIGVKMTLIIAALSGNLLNKQPWQLPWWLWKLGLCRDSSVWWFCGFSWNTLKLTTIYHESMVSRHLKKTLLHSCSHKDIKIIKT